MRSFPCASVFGTIVCTAAWLVASITSSERAMSSSSATSAGGRLSVFRKATALALSSSLAATSSMAILPSSMARARACPMAPSPTTPTLHVVLPPLVMLAPLLDQRAFEDDAAIEGGDGPPEPFPETRVNLWALGELATQIDQPSEGSDQVPFMTSIGFLHQPGPVLLARGPAI